MSDIPTQAKLTDEQILKHFRVRADQGWKPSPNYRAIADAAAEKAYEQAFKDVWQLLVKHKEYQRRWKGGLQILFGFNPDELDELKQGRMP